MNKYICIVHTDASSVCVHTHYYTHPSKRVCMCYICIVRTPTKCCAQNEGTDRYAEQGAVCCRVLYTDASSV